MDTRVDLLNAYMMFYNKKFNKTENLLSDCSDKLNVQMELLHHEIEQYNKKEFKVLPIEDSFDNVYIDDDTFILHFDNEPKYMCNNLIPLLLLVVERGAYECDWTID